MKKAVLINIFLNCFIISVWAQESTISHSIYNRLVLNPAYTGNEGNGAARISLYNKIDYLNIRGPFRYNSLSIDYGFCNQSKQKLTIGCGLKFDNYTQGDGFLNQNNINLLVGIHLPLKKFWILSGGISVGYLSQSIEWNKLIFSDQLDPILGITSTPSSNSNANIQYNNSFKPCIGFKLTNWDDEDKYIWTLGFNIDNALGDGKIGLLSNSFLSKRYIIHGSWMYRRNKQIDGAIQLNSRFDIQENFKILVITEEYYLNKNLSFGFSQRFSNISSGNIITNAQSLGLMLGLQPRKDFKIVFSAETYLGGLTNSYITEFGLIWAFSRSICNGRDLVDYLKNGPKSGEGACQYKNFSKHDVIQSF